MWIYVTVPMLCAISVSIGVYHLLKLAIPAQAHDSMIALNSYLKSSLQVFLRRQLWLIVATMVFFLIASTGLFFLDLHLNLFPLLVIWGVFWSSVIGYIAIKKSTALTAGLLQLSVDDPENWSRQINRLGWALTLIPLGFLSGLLWVWMTIFQYAAQHNILHTGDRLLAQAGLTGPWTPAVAAHPAFLQAQYTEMGIVLLAFCCGPMIQAFLVNITTRMMTQATSETCKELDYLYPGMGADDLRNPASMAYHIGQYAHQIWGKFSHTINIYFTLLLSATTVAVAAVRESGGMYPATMILMPFVVISLGLAGAACASVITDRLSRQLGLMGVVVSCGTLFFSASGMLHWRVAVGVCVSFFIAAGLLWLFHHHVFEERAPYSQRQFLALRHTLFVVAFVLVWISGAFVLGHGSVHILVGLNAVALTLLACLGAFLPQIARSQSNGFVDIGLGYSRILQIETDIMQRVEPVIRQQQGVSVANRFLDMMTGLGSIGFLFFIFFDTLPYWLQKLYSPEATSKISSVLAGKSLSALSFEDLDLLFGIFPTKGSFLVGFLGSLVLALGIGVVWLWVRSRIQTKLLSQIQPLLETHEDIVSGQSLPDYTPCIHSVTTLSYQCGFGLLVSLCFGVLLLGAVIGFGSISGLVLGMLILTLGASVHALYAAYLRIQTQQAELIQTVLALSTQALIVFAILFGVLVLHFGYGMQ